MFSCLNCKMQMYQLVTFSPPNENSFSEILLTCIRESREHYTRDSTKFWNKQ